MFCLNTRYLPKEPPPFKGSLHLVDSNEVLLS